jgi:hypothetical protein
LRASRAEQPAVAVTAPGGDTSRAEQSWHQEAAEGEEIRVVV